MRGLLKERTIRSVMRNCVSDRGISYIDDGAGPPIMLLHAFGLDRSMWDAQRDFLVRGGFRTFVPDMRGFGESPPPPDDYSFAVSVADALDVLDHAGVTSAVIVGLSMGAAIAVDLVTTAPSRVAGLLLADNSLPDGKERGSTAAARIRDIGTERLADFYEPILFAANYRRGHADAIDVWRRRLAALDAEALATIVLPYHARRDPSGLLGEIAVPTAIVYGAEDAAITGSRRNDYLAIPGSSRWIIDDAGHCSNLEQPERFNEIVADLLATIPGWEPQNRRVETSSVPVGTNRERSHAHE